MPYNQFICAMNLCCDAHWFIQSPLLKYGHCCDVKLDTSQQRDKANQIKASKIQK